MRLLAALVLTAALCLAAPPLHAAPLPPPLDLVQDIVNAHSQQEPPSFTARTSHGDFLCQLSNFATYRCGTNKDLSTATSEDVLRLNAWLHEQNKAVEWESAMDKADVESEAGAETPSKKVRGIRQVMVPGLQENAMGWVAKIHSNNVHDLTTVTINFGDVW